MRLGVDRKQKCPELNNIKSDATVESRWVTQKECSEFREEDWAVCSGAYRNSLELRLRNKVDKKEEKPVWWKKAGRHKVYPLSVWDIMQADWPGTAKASLRQGLKSSGTQYAVQDCEAIWVKAFTAAWATVECKACVCVCVYVQALCKTSYESKATFLKRVGNQWSRRCSCLDVGLWYFVTWVLEWIFLSSMFSYTFIWIVRFKLHPQAHIR